MTICHFFFYCVIKVKYLITVINYNLETFFTYSRKGSGSMGGRNRKSFDKQDSSNGSNGGITTESPKEEMLLEKEDTVKGKTENTEN